MNTPQMDPDEELVQTLHRNPTFSVVLNLRGTDGTGRLLRVNTVWWYRFLTWLDLKAGREEKYAAERANDR